MVDEASGGERALDAQRRQCFARLFRFHTPDTMLRRVGGEHFPARTMVPSFKNQKSTHPKMNCVSNLSHVPRFVQSSLNEAGSGEWALDAQRCECFTRLSANTTHQTPNIKHQTPPLNIPPNHTPKTSNHKPHSPNAANSHPTPHTRW